MPWFQRWLSTYADWQHASARHPHHTLTVPPATHLPRPPPAPALQDCVPACRVQQAREQELAAAGNDFWTLNDIIADSLSADTMTPAGSSTSSRSTSSSAANTLAGRRGGGGGRGRGRGTAAGRGSSSSSSGRDLREVMRLYFSDGAVLTRGAELVRRVSELLDVIVGHGTAAAQAGGAGLQLLQQMAAAGVPKLLTDMLIAAGA